MYIPSMAEQGLSQLEKTLRMQCLLSLADTLRIKPKIKERPRIHKEVEWAAANGNRHARIHNQAYKEERR